jgi:hypothetical protein
MRKLRERRIPFAARRLGLSFSSTDPFGLASRGLPFELFQQRGLEVRNVMFGRLGSVEVKGFDARYVTYGGRDVGWVPTEWRFFALADIPANGPSLSVVRGPAAAPKDERNVSFESGQFNQEFTVSTSDPRFASAVVDERMMAWLLDSVPDDVSFQIEGRYVLATKRDGAEMAEDVLQVLPAVAGFVTHFPRAATSLYPPT